MSRSMVALVVLLAACAADVGDGKAVATVAEVPASTAPATPVAEGFTVPALSAAKLLDVDVAHSKLGALGAKITAQHPIVFHEFAGKVGMDGEAVTGVAFTAKIASLEADQERLTGHLKKPDFLDAAAFPYATFASTEVKVGSDQPAFTHTVTGDLTIHGKTMRVTFPAAISVDATQVGAKTEFVINRQDFGVTYPGKPDDLVQDNVVLQVSFVAPRT